MELRFNNLKLLSLSFPSRKGRNKSEENWRKSEEQRVSLEMVDTSLDGSTGDVTIKCKVPDYFSKEVRDSKVVSKGIFFPAETDSENSNMFTLMFKVLPDPTIQSLADFEKSLELLNGIAAEDRLPGDDFKLAMFNTASAILTLKRFDTNLDGEVTAGELTNFSDATATSLLAQIGAAESLLAGDDSSKDGAAAASSFSTFRTELAKQEGATDEEKLANFLSSTNPE
jgi:hypothetical protein